MKFIQNLWFGSRDGVQTSFFLVKIGKIYSFYSVVTLKIKSRSPKSNQIFKPSQHYNTWICHSVQEIVGCRQAFWSNFEDFKVLMWPWKWGKGHQNLITIFSLPMMRLCKFGQNPPIGTGDRVQTRGYADTDRICTKSNMSPLPFGWGI